MDGNDDDDDDGDDNNNNNNDNNDYISSSSLSSSPLLLPSSSLPMLSLNGSNRKNTTLDLSMNQFETFLYEYPGAFD